MVEAFVAVADSVVVVINAAVFVARDGVAAAVFANDDELAAKTKPPLHPDYWATNSDCENVVVVVAAVVEGEQHPQDVVAAAVDWKVLKLGELLAVPIDDEQPPKVGDRQHPLHLRVFPFR